MISRQVVTIFVSSVFRDMHVERDLLNRFLMPEVQEKLRQRGRDCSIQCVDLRWGLNVAEATETREIVEVCLEEIERAKPYFLCILGQAYGSETDLAVAEALAQQFRFDIHPDSRGVTDIEIQFALRQQERGESMPLFVFREPRPGAADEPKMAALKRRLAERTPTGIVSYSRFDSADEMNSWVVWMSDRLVEWLEPQLEADDTVDDDPAREHERKLSVFLADIAEKTIPREAVTRSFADHMAAAEAAHGPKLLLMAAAPGAGKTTIAASLPQELKGRGFLTLCHFVDLSDDGYSVDKMLRRFCDQLGEASGCGQLSDDTWSAGDPGEIFASLLDTVSANRPVAVIVDTLEDMEQGPLGQLLTWWPRSLRGQAALLVTCRNPEPIIEAWGLDRAALLALPAFGATETANLIKAICQKRQRHLSQAALDAILAKRTTDEVSASANPLWTLILIEELNLFEADDFALIATLSGDGGARVGRLLLKFIQAAPAEIPALYQFVFERMERALGREAVAAFVGFLSITRTGLRPSDFLALSKKAGGAQPLTPLMLAQLRHRLRSQLVTTSVDGAWRFQHAMACEAACARYLPSSVAVTAAHAEVALHLDDLPVTDVLRLYEHSYQLWKSGRTLDLCRAVAHGANNSDARTLLEATAPEAMPTFDLRAALADPELNTHQAIELSNFLSERVVYLAKRQRALAFQLAILEKIDAGLADRIAFVSNDDSDRTEHARARHAIHTFIRLNAAGQYARAHTLIRGTLETLEALSVRDPSSLEKLEDLYQGLEAAGHSSLNMNDLDTALKQLNRAVEIARRLMIFNPSDNTRHTLSLALAWLGVAQLTKSGPEAALATFEEACELGKHSAKARKAGGPRVNTMALEHLIDIKGRLGDYQGAYECGEELLMAIERVLETDPGDLETLRQLSTARLFVGAVLAALGRNQQAETEYKTCIQGMLTVLKSAPDDITARRNVVSAAAALDQLWLAQLRLTSEPPFATEITELTTDYEQWRSSKTTAIASNYSNLAETFLDAKLLTAAEICMSRCVWWMSRFRGETREPSQEAMSDAFKIAGHITAAILRLQLDLRRYVRANPPRLDSPLPPAFVSPVDTEAKTGPLDLSAFDAIMLAVTAAIEAIFQAAQSARSPQRLNTLRWIEHAEALVARIEAIGLNIDANAKQVLAELRRAAGGGEPAAVPGDTIEGAKPSPIEVVEASSTPSSPASTEGATWGDHHPADPFFVAASASPPSLGRVTELADRLVALGDARMEMSAKERHGSVLEFFHQHIARARGEYGPLLYEPELAAPLIEACLSVALDLRALRQDSEARFALQLAADAAMGVGDSQLTKAIAETGLMAIALLYEPRPGQGAGAENEQMRARTNFAVRLAGLDGASEMMRRLAAHIQSYLAQRLVIADRTSEEAEHLFESSATILEGVYRDGQNRDDGLDASSKWNSIGEIMLSRGRTSEAAAHFEKALVLRRRLLADATGSQADEAKVGYFVASSLTRLADIRLAENDSLAAADLFLEAEKIRVAGLQANVPDRAEATKLLWWVRSRAADCFLYGGAVEEGLYWATRSNEVVDEQFRSSPDQLPRLLASVGLFIDAAEKAASQSDHELWRAWTLRAKLTLDALRNAGAPIKEYETFMDQIRVSQVFGDEPLPLAPELLECFDAARRRDLNALEVGIACHGASERESKALVGLLESLKLEAVDKFDKAALQITRALEEYSSHTVSDQRISTFLRAHHVRLLIALGLGELFEDERRFLRISALVIYGPESREFVEIEEMVNGRSAQA